MISKREKVGRLKIAVGEICPEGVYALLKTGDLSTNSGRAFLSGTGHPLKLDLVVYHAWSPRAAVFSLG